MTDDTKVTTADEYEKLAYAKAWEDPTPVHMPSGAVFILRRPKALWFALQLVDLPGTLAAKATGGEASSNLTPEQIVSISRFWVKTFEGMFVSPELREKPGAGQIGYRRIPMEDREFLLDFANGSEISLDGNLGNFRDESVASRTGADGGTVEVQTESVTQ